jgi:endonuclease/exonuclease/phosphatase family metal-dependent hydrolase
MDHTPTARVKVLTWNIWWRFGPHWQDRQPALLKTLREVDADVLALQEVWGNAQTTQAHEFAAALRLHAGFAEPSYPPVSDVPRAGEDEKLTLGLGLLSRWPITSLERIELPARHRPFSPVAMVARLEHPAGPLPIVVACLEYESAYNDDRMAQAQALADLATDPALDGALPIIVAGDLNAAPNSSVLRPLREVMTDAWRAGGGDSAAVTLPSSHPSAPLEAAELIDQRIDHIFYRPGEWAQRVTVESAITVGAAVDGIYPSDHRAIACQLSWRAGS